MPSGKGRNSNSAARDNVTHNDDNRSDSLSPSHHSSPVTPDIPSLATLVAQNTTGEYFSNEYLFAIIIKAQPYHSHRTLGHLTRSQLIDHVDALILWWKKANPRKLSLITQYESSNRSGSISSRSTSSTYRDDCCCVIT